MRLQKVTCIIEGKLHTRWAGSQADAASCRKEILGLGGKRADTKTEEVDVPTTKVELLAFLNKLTDEASNAD